MNLNDKNVNEYLDFVNEHELPEPAQDKELAFVTKNDADSDFFADTYSAFAANLAKDWYDKNGWRGTSLSHAVKAANEGLFYARQLYVDNKVSYMGFKEYTEPFIEDRLNKLVQKESKQY